MGITWNDIQVWNRSRLDDAARRLSEQQEHAANGVLIAAAHQILSSGKTVDAIKNKRAELLKESDERVKEIEELKKATETAAEGVADVQEAVKKCKKYLEEHPYLSIKEDGSVDIDWFQAATAAPADVWKNGIPNPAILYGALAGGGAAGALVAFFTWGNETKGYLETLVRYALERAGEVDRPYSARLKTLQEGKLQEKSPGAADDPKLREILYKYQVADDDMVPWNPAWGFMESRMVTASEAKMLDGLGGPSQKLIILNGIKDDAENRAKQEYPPPDKKDANGNVEKDANGNPVEDVEDNHTDAYRHIYASARLAKEFGPEWAEQFTTAHERRPGAPIQREAMDLYNNSIGINYIREHPNASVNDIQKFVKESIQKGDAIVIDNKGDIGWSNNATPYKVRGEEIPPPLAPSAPPPPGHASEDKEPIDGRDPGVPDAEPEDKRQRGIR